MKLIKIILSFITIPSITAFPYSLNVENNYICNYINPMINSDNFCSTKESHNVSANIDEPELLDFFDENMWIDEFMNSDIDSATKVNSNHLLNNINNMHYIDTPFFHNCVNEIAAQLSYILTKEYQELTFESNDDIINDTIKIQPDFDITERINVEACSIDALRVALMAAVVDDGNLDGELFSLVRKIYQQNNIDLDFALFNALLMYSSAEKLGYIYCGNQNDSDNFFELKREIYNKNDKITSYIDSLVVTENKHLKPFSKEIHKLCQKYLPSIREIRLETYKENEINRLKINVLKGDTDACEKLENIYEVQQRNKKYLLPYYIIMAKYYNILDYYWKSWDLYKKLYGNQITPIPMMIVPLLKEGARKGSKECANELQNFNELDYEIIQIL